MKHFENPSLSTHRNNELNKYRKIGKFTDLILRSTDGEIMKVHKHIISASCPYLKTLINNSPKNVIQLVDDVTIADLEILVEYFYTGKANFSSENAKNLYIKAQYFQLSELQEFCSEILIENTKIENCLEYFQNSVKYLIKNLQVKCLQIIKSNCKSFLEKHVLKLTADEFKLITSEENLIIDQVDLYKSISKWVKADFESRDLHLMELIKNLDFTKISADFIENEIIPDEILKNNREFVTKIFSITFQKLRSVENQLNQKSEVKINSINSKFIEKIYLTTNDGIYKLNWNESKWEKKFTFETRKSSDFATVALTENIYISGGLSKYPTRYPCANFEFWNISSRKIIELPKMLESRYGHKLFNFKGKIYFCGGYGNKGSTELYDYENSKWSKGPSMNESKYSFGKTTDNSLYAFGGYNEKEMPSKIVEQFDQRDGKWSIISRDAPEIYEAVVLSNDSVYCFNNIYGGKIFDHRTNTWADSLAKVFEPKEEFKYYSSCCDIVEFRDEILGVFPTDNNKNWGTYKFDANTNKWDNLNIPLSLNNQYAGIKLSVISDPS